MLAAVPRDFVDDALKNGNFQWEIDFAKVFLDAVDGIESGLRAGRNFLDYFQKYKIFKVNFRRAGKFTFIDCEFC